MTKKVLRELWLALAVAATVPSARADVWDLAQNDDDDNQTTNALAHGVEQTHDLAGVPVVSADEDWYVAPTAARSSYELVLDNAAGDLDLAEGKVQRVAPDGTVLQSADDVAGQLLRLRWKNADSSGLDLVRVRDGACESLCTDLDQYRIRFYDTTYSIPRFNNNVTQSTFIIVGSLTAGTCDADFHFYDAAGALLGTTTRAFAARQPSVINTSTLTFAAGRSGWVVVAHTCGYGMLVGKAVAVEAATGFAFDTPFVPRPL